MKNITATNRSIISNLFTLLLALSMTITPFSIYAVGITEEAGTSVQISKTDGNVYISAEEHQDEANLRNIIYFRTAALPPYPTLKQYISKMTMAHGKK